MNYQAITKNILHELGLNKNYSGMDYVSYGVQRISENEEVLIGITKGLYIDIAAHFHTTHICVEKNIRKAIETIWSDENNKGKIVKIFGKRYETLKPTNKVFLELLYEYVRKRILCENRICPLSNVTCQVYKEIIQDLFDL